MRPHDWITIFVSDEVLVQQCVRCRMAFVQYVTMRDGESCAAGEYFPSHIAAPPECTRGDMTEDEAAHLKTGASQ